MECFDPAHGAGARAHGDGVGEGAVLRELDAAQHVAVGDARGGEEDVAAGELGGVVDAFGVPDAHALGALPLLVGVENEPALHLAAHAAHGGGREHALGRGADADIHVDAGHIRVGRVDDAGHVAVGDETDGGAASADLLDQLRVAGAVHDAGVDRG